MFCTIYVLSVFSCATTTKGDMEEHINIVDFESKLIRLQDVLVKWILCLCSQGQSGL